MLFINFENQFHQICAILTIRGLHLQGIRCQSETKNLSQCRIYLIRKGWDQIITKWNFKIEASHNPPSKVDEQHKRITSYTNTRVINNINIIFINIIIIIIINLDGMIPIL